MQNRTTDEDIIAEIAKGNSSAFNKLFLAYYTALLNFCISLGLEKDQAEDTVSDLFTDLWVNREKLKIHTSVKSYLYGAARNKTNMVFRSKPKATFVDYDAAEEVPSDKFAQPDERLMAKDKHQRVARLIESLPEQSRLIFILRWQHQLSDQEVAEMLKKNVNTVRTLLYRAVKFMRDHLTKVN